MGEVRQIVVGVIRVLDEVWDWLFGADESTEAPKPPVPDGYKSPRQLVAEGMRKNDTKTSTACISKNTFFEKLCTDSSMP